MPVVVPTSVRRTQRPARSIGPVVLAFVAFALALLVVMLVPSPKTDGTTEAPALLEGP